MTRSVFWPRCRILFQVVLDAHTADPRKNSRPLVLDCAPKSCTVVRNGYHEPSTFTAEVDSRILPFDPDSIASLAATVYMWDSEGDETRPWHIQQYEMIRGLVDDDGWRVGDGQHITVSGRDYQAVLDSEWDPRQMIPSGVPIDEAVQAVADLAAPKGNANRFAVEFVAKKDDGSPLSPPIIGGALRSTKKKGMWVKPGKTFWEVIYEMCTRNGFIVYMGEARAAGGGVAIIIDNPRTQSTDTLAEAPRVVYGRDLIWMDAKRKLGKQKVPRIILVYWDPRTRQEVRVVYPENAREITTGLGLKKNEDMLVPAPQGCIDRETALRYAKMRFDLLARQEAEYTFLTNHMKVGAKHNFQDETGSVFSESVEFDMMQLRAGDAIGIEFDPFNLEHLRSLQVGERTEFILGMGYPPRIAQFVAANVERITQFKQPYYCHKVTYTFDEESGLDIEVEGVNFASEAREVAWADGRVPDAVTGAG